MERSVPHSAVGGNRTACSGACAAARPTRMRRQSRNAFHASTSSFAESALPRRLSLVADGDLSYGGESHRTSRATTALTPLAREEGQVGYRWNAADGFTSLPSGRPRPFSLPRPRLLNAYVARRFALFCFAARSAKTPKMPKTPSPFSLRPLRPLRLKPPFPFPCLPCIPRLNNPPPCNGRGEMVQSRHLVRRRTPSSTNGGPRPAQQEKGRRNG